MKVFSSKRSESSPETLETITSLEYTVMDHVQSLPPRQRIQMLISRYSLWTPLTALPLSDDREGLGVTVTDLDAANSVVLIGQVGGGPEREWTIGVQIFLFNDGPMRKEAIVVDGIVLQPGDILPEKYRQYCLAE